MRRAVSGRVPGVAVAGATAAISGVSVFVNSYGVRAVTSPAVYTTAKNVVAALVLCAVAGVAWRAKWPPLSLGNFVTVERTERAPRAAVALALAYVGVVSGGLAFVLFFNGLASSAPAAAAFWRDTMLIWVAVLAGSALSERVRWWNGAAIALVVLGQVIVAGGVGPVALSSGELAVLASSVLWAVEVVLIRRLLRGLAPALVSVVRMGGGSITLLVYLGATGQLGALAGLDATQWSWAAGTGLLLAGYVATWTTALSRARAVDVSSVLVGGAVLTWLLQAAAGTAPLTGRAAGLVLVAAGVGLVAVGAARQRGDALGAPGRRAPS